jgi:hypothetical protein
VNINATDATADRSFADTPADDGTIAAHDDLSASNTASGLREPSRQNATTAALPDPLTVRRGRGVLEHLSSVISVARASASCRLNAR